MISVKFVFKRGLGCLLNVYQEHWAMTCAMHEISSLICSLDIEAYQMRKPTVPSDKEKIGMWISLSENSFCRISYFVGWCSANQMACFIFLS